MKYPIAIEQGDDPHAWGVVVPDLPGCFSAADSGPDEAVENAKEAIALWIEGALDAGLAIPQPGSIAQHRNNPDYAGFMWALVEIDPALLDDTVERVNITLPRRVLSSVDRYAEQHGMSRSGFLARAAIEAMR